MEAGTVTLVGAGPGAPDLITVRGLRALEQAEVAVYDRLMPDELLDAMPPECERIYAGKGAGHHLLPQDDINAALIDRARRGYRVVRLKGGDPFLFGRGGEEAEAMTAAGIPCEIIPGVTAAAACGAASGIPLTHRQHAAGVTLVTGHRRRGAPDLDWTTLARSTHTLVFYMGLSNLGHISERLIAHGLAPETPAACILHGATARQTVHTASLVELPGAVPDEATPPALILVGEVVAHRMPLDGAPQASNVLPETSHAG